jgi:hypothetical protein
LDGTAASEGKRAPLGESLDSAPMTSLHTNFWALAALGIMLDGFDFFIIGDGNRCSSLPACASSRS